MSRHVLGIAIAVVVSFTTAHADPTAVSRPPNAPAPATRDPESRPATEQRYKTPPPALDPGSAPTLYYTAPAPPPLYGDTRLEGSMFVPTAPERPNEPRESRHRAPKKGASVAAGDPADTEPIYLEWRHAVRAASAADLWHVELAMPPREVSHARVDSAWVCRLVAAIDGASSLDTSAAACRAPWGEPGLVLAVRFVTHAAAPSLLIVPDESSVQLYERDRAIGSMKLDDRAALLDLALDALPADADVRAARDEAGSQPDAVLAAGPGARPAPDDRPLDRLLAPIVTAESVMVWHPLGSMSDPLDKPPPALNRAYLGHEWAQHFVQALGGGAYHALPASEAPAWHPDSLASAERIEVRPAGDHATTVEVYPGRRAAIVTSGGKPRAYVEVSQVMDRLLELAVQALPRDPSVRQHAEVAKRSSISAEDLRKLPVTDLPPKFGEYVYVEDLPEAITKVPPAYPDDAIRARIQGTVLVQALVGADGHVKDTRVTKSIPRLDDAAVACVRQWIFKPALSKGRPVAVWVAVPVKFTLH